MLLPFQGVRYRGAFPRALPWTVSLLAFQAVRVGSIPRVPDGGIEGIGSVPRVQGVRYRGCQYRPPHPRLRYLPAQ